MVDDVSKIPRVTKVETADGVSLGAFPNEEPRNKYGHNDSVSTGSCPEDVWEGGGLYTGFNATAAEELTLVSSSTHDVGSDKATGTITGGTGSSIVDAEGTFLGDATVGDCFVNVTQGTHGIIKTVENDSRLTVHLMHGDTPNRPPVNAIGDSYRIVQAAGNGAALVRLTNILNANYEPQTPIYVTLNGTSEVTTSGASAMRCDEGAVVLAGSVGSNSGIIGCTQAVSTANVFFAMPAGKGHTQVCALTTPAGTLALLETVDIVSARSNGGLGSVTAELRTRKIGEAWQSERVFELTTAVPVNKIFKYALQVPEKTDVIVTTTAVSDNGTVVQAELDFKLIT